MTNQLGNLIAHYQKALTIKPDNATLYQKIAELHQCSSYHNRDFSKIAFCYLKSIQLKPDLFGAYYQLDFILRNLHKLSHKDNNQLLEQGIEILQNNTTIQPDFPFAHVVLGTLYAQQGKIEFAKSCYQKASYQRTSKSHPQLVKSAWKSSQRRKPDFLVIGILKCGTSFLFNHLTYHPQVLPPITKEVHYFTQSHIEDLDYYLSHFPAVSDKNYLTGEATPDYFTFPTIAREIFSLSPNIKLIILLRNPVERTISSFYWYNSFANKYLRKHLKGSHSIDMRLVGEIVNQLPKSLKQEKNCPNNIEAGISSHITFSLYIYYLREWFSIFPREQFLILKSEDLFTESVSTMKQVYDFLGLPNHSLARHSNQNSNTYPPISPDLRQQMAEFFQPYNQELEEYLGRKFNWD